MNHALNYENFLRSAFSIFSDQGNGGRVEDPAKLADRELFNNPHDLTRVKIGTSYAMEVYNTYIKIRNVELGNEELNRMSSILEDVLKATSHEEISNLIEEYTNRFFDLSRAARVESQ